MVGTTGWDGAAASDLAFVGSEVVDGDCDDSSLMAGSTMEDEENGVVS